VAWKAKVWRATEKRVEQRGTAAERGYDSRWRKARAVWLAEHPLCAECMKRGEVKAATDVDHVVPHRGDAVRFWMQGNWQSLCGTCHKKKTARGE
jgi:5-methylcytosine-specific restriction protein A